MDPGKFSHRRPPGATNSLLKKSQGNARQGKNRRKSAVYTSVHEHFEPRIHALSRRLRVFQQAVGLYPSVFALGWALVQCAPVLAQVEEPAPAATGSQSLERFLQETRTLRAEFRQEIWDSEGRLIETAAGTLSLKRPNRFFWNYREPFEQLVIADAENLWIYDVELAQVTVTPLDESVTASPAMLLSGDQAVRDGFEILESFEISDVNWVRLRPRLDGTDFRSVLIGFAAGTLSSLELVDGLDQKTRIQFAEVEVNPEIGDEVFDFDPPDNVDVIGQPGAPDP